MESLNKLMVARTYTMPLNGGEFIDLQPDGNSFDMMKGLISTKKQ
jgi:hypothetical protein